VTGNRADALARLDVFASERVMEAWFSGGRPALPGAAGDGPQARSRPEWASGRQFLLQRTKIPVPEAPGSLAIASAGPQAGAHARYDFALTCRRAGLT